MSRLGVKVKGSELLIGTLGYLDPPAFDVKHVISRFPLIGDLGLRVQGLGFRD
jgi:hypothetical protein